MTLSELPYSTLRRFLLDLEFTEKPGPSCIIFKHAPSETTFIFRPYDTKENIHWPDLISVRKQLDERGLLASDSFDKILLRTPA
jgi:hypothetical protein